MQTKHLCVLIHIWTKGDIGAPLNRLKSSSKIFLLTVPRGCFFCGSFMFFLSCFVMLSCTSDICLLMPCGHLLGKSWSFCSRLRCLIVKLSLSHWYHGSGVVLDCIDSWYLPSFLLYFCSLARHGLVLVKCLMRLSDTMVHLLCPLEVDPFCFYFWDWHKIYWCTVRVCWKKRELDPCSHFESHTQHVITQCPTL